GRREERGRRRDHFGRGGSGHRPRDPDRRGGDDRPRDPGRLGDAVMTQPLSPDDVRRIDAYWRAANYLSVGQIYLFDNPLLREPLQLKHIKPRLLGHWGTTPGLNFVYAHLNRVIKAHDL